MADDNRKEQAVDESSAGKGFLGTLLTPLEAITGPWTRANGVGWLQLLVFILVLRWGFIELYSIPSGSMETTLHGDERFLHGDRVAVNKFLFGPRIPFTTIRLLKLGEPRRWDIVVFNSIEENPLHERLIKRVAGLPGERIHIADGNLYVNGEVAVPPEGLEHVLHYTDRTEIPDNTVRLFLLRLAQTRTVPRELMANAEAAGQLNNELQRLAQSVQAVDLESLGEARTLELTQEVDPKSLDLVLRWLQERQPAEYGIREEDEYSVVPEGHYFMLGDNSPNSYDGRYYGWVPHENLYGRAFAIALPPRHMKDLTGFTGTWTGKLLLYGIPAALFFYEYTRSFLVFSWKIRGTAGGPTFQPGDRLMVNRLSLGWRLPFSKRRLAGDRPLFPGEWFAFIDSGTGGGSEGLLFGRAVETPSTNRTDGSACVLATRADAEDDHPSEIRRDEIVGRVSAIWWPPHRARRFA